MVPLVWHLGSGCKDLYIEYLLPERHPKLFDWYNTYTLFFIWILKYLSLGLVLEYSSTWVPEYLSTKGK